MQIEFSDQELAFLKEGFEFELKNDKSLSKFARATMEGVVEKINQKL